MSIDNSQSGKRRQFLRGGLRCVTGGLLALAGGAAVVKRQRLLREGKCLNRGICGQCRLIQDCGLPRALSVKQALGRSEYGG